MQIINVADKFSSMDQKPNLSSQWKNHVGWEKSARQKLTLLEAKL